MAIVELVESTCTRIASTASAGDPIPNAWLRTPVGFDPKSAWLDAGVPVLMTKVLVTRFPRASFRNSPQAQLPSRHSSASRPATARRRWSKCICNQQSAISNQQSGGADRGASACEARGVYGWRPGGSEGGARRGTRQGGIEWAGSGVKDGMGLDGTKLDGMVWGGMGREEKG